MSRGGKREGAGRKAGAPTATHPVRCRDEGWAWLQSQALGKGHTSVGKWADAAGRKAPKRKGNGCTCIAVQWANNHGQTWLGDRRLKLWAKLRRPVQPMTQKQKTAEAIFRQAKELGIKLESKGNWINATPPSKVPTQMLIELAQCPNELGALICNQTPTHEPSLRPCS